MDHLPSWHQVCIWQLINHEEFVYLKMQKEFKTRQESEYLWDQSVRDQLPRAEYSHRMSELRIWQVVAHKWEYVKSLNDQENDRVTLFEVMSRNGASPASIVAGPVRDQGEPRTGQEDEVNVQCE